MDLRRLLFLLVLGCGLLSASPALAVTPDVTINIVSRAAGFPAATTIGPDQTVQWKWVGASNERNHSPAANPVAQLETWDPDPGVVKPDFDHGLNHTFDH